VVSDAGIFAGIDKGFFDEQGFSVELQRMSSATQTVLLATGQLDVGGGGANPGLVNAVAGGLPIRLVADKGSAPLGHGFNLIVARQDLFESGAITGLANLAGKTIATDGPASVAMFQLDRSLATVGLSNGDVTIEHMAFPDMITALANGRIDAAWEVEPFGTLAERSRAGRIIFTVDQALPDFQVAAIFLGKTFFQDQSELGRRWMVAYVRGLRFYNDASKDSSVRSELVEIIARQTNINDEGIFDTMIWPGLHPDGTLNLTNLRDQIRWFRANGQIETEVPENQLFDPGFAEAAVKELGPYRA
jgi:NitT/TauT family transport system substrate-binding protein